MGSGHDVGMTSPQDALLLSALELQLSAIASPNAKLAPLRAQVAAAAPTEWRGGARDAFIAAVQVVAYSVEIAEDAARNALSLTRAAVREVASRA